MLDNFNQNIENNVYLCGAVSLNISKKSITKIQTNCQSIIPYGSVYSALGIRLNSHCRNITELFSYPREQIIGHLLGDGSLFISKTSTMPCFYFTQTMARIEYIWFVFNHLSHLCEVKPDFNMSVRKGTISHSLRVRTRSYPFFNELHELFYIKENGKWKKIISNDIINYLTPRALAFWVMDDGAATASGLYLHTEGFEYKDVYKLAGILNYNFNLNVTVQNHSNKPMIYIKSKSQILPENNHRNFRVLTAALPFKKGSHMVLIF